MGLGSNHQGSLDLRLGGTLACHSRVKQSGPVDGAALEHLQAGGCARAILLLNSADQLAAMPQGPVTVQTQVGHA